MPKNLPSPPTYRKVNPAELADPAARRDLGHAAADRGRRQRRDPARAADQPDHRRRPGLDRRPAEARDPHPARSGQAGRQGPVAGGCAHAARRSPPSTAPRAASTAQKRSFTIYTNDQLTDRQGLERRHRRLSQRRTAARPRHRPGGDRARRIPSRPAWADGKRGVVPGRSSSSPAPTSSTRSTRSRRRCRACAPRCRRRSTSSRLSDRTQTIRASVEDVQFTLLLTIALVVMVIFVFLRSLLGDHHSRASPCRWRCSAPARLMWPVRLQPRQPVADGADDLGRLRRRRCHRHAGEHHALRRGR